jgi:anti-sigma factor RsiW
MSGPTRMSDEDLNALIDGELSPAHARPVHDALRADASLKARADALAADKRALAALYAPIADAPIPTAWLARIEAATAPIVPVASLARRDVRRRRAVFSLAMAACLAIIALVTLLRPQNHGSILAEATAARRDLTHPILRLAGPALLDEGGRDAALRHAVGLAVRAPDLTALHWRLTELETYPHAAALRYRNDTGQALTVYVRPSAGPPRFDLLKDGKIRTCVWQDEVVGAVMMGDMSAGQMMRVASAAYLSLNL